MTIPVRWGIVSTARINTPVIAGLRAVDGAELVAVASREGARAEAYAAEHGIPTAHGSYEALFADPAVEAVYISLPNGLHHAWTMRALDAGKHVLCEKPYSRRPADVVEAFDRAEAAGLVLSEAFMWRHNPQTALLAQAVEDVGPVESIHAAFSFVLDDRSDHRLAPPPDGGALMDVGCYCVNATRLVAGEDPARVYAEQTLDCRGADLSLGGLLVFPSGARASIACSFASERETIQVIGAGGVVEVDDPWFCTRGRIVVDGQERAVDPVSSYACEVANVSAAVRGEAELLLGRADALGQARTIDALYRSAATGEVAALDG